MAIVILATFKRNRTVTLVLGCVAILSSLAALYCMAAPLAPRIAFGAMVIDGQSVLFITIILLSSLAILLIAHGFLLDVKEPQEEFLLALLMGTMGAMTVCAADQFALFFMGLETLSISMYMMIAYGKNRYFGIEAAIKYLIQASIAAAFLLFGMALLYAETGFLEPSKIASALSHGAALSPLSSIGLIMMLVGIGYKLALVPFHFWAPDTYQGAPTPTTTFIVTISKTAVFAFLLRFYLGFGEHPVVTLKTRFMDHGNCLDVHWKLAGAFSAKHEAHTRLFIGGARGIFSFRNALRPLRRFCRRLLSYRVYDIFAVRARGHYFTEGKSGRSERFRHPGIDFHSTVFSFSPGDFVSFIRGAAAFSGVFRQNMDRDRGNQVKCVALGNKRHGGKPDRDLLLSTNRGGAFSEARRACVRFGFYHP